jgi:hypothetical protein
MDIAFGFVRQKDRFAPWPHDLIPIVYLERPSRKSRNSAALQKTCQENRSSEIRARTTATNVSIAERLAVITRREMQADSGNM